MKQPAAIAVWVAVAILVHIILWSGFDEPPAPFLIVDFLVSLAVVYGIDRLWVWLHTRAK